MSQNVSRVSHIICFPIHTLTDAVSSLWKRIGTLLKSIFKKEKSEVPPLNPNRFKHSNLKPVKQRILREGEIVADPKKIQAAKDKILSAKKDLVPANLPVSCCDNRSTRQILLRELQERGKEQNPQLVSLFDQLKSQDQLTVQKAEEEIRYLQDQQVSFHTIVLHSFPLWPVDASALKQIALDQSESRHPLLRERAFHACSYLVTHCSREGYEAAAILASKKMRSEDETVQEEGFKYFVLLLNQWQPQLSQDDLVIAVLIGKKICMTDQWIETSQFFEMLVKHGREADVALLKNTVIDLCASDNSHAFYVGRNICDLIVNNHHNSANLVAISLEAAILMCTSEVPFRRSQSLDLFWSLLRWTPASTIDPLLQALEVESQRKNPEIRILGRLDELAGHDFSNLSQNTKEVVLQRAKKDAPALLRILTNLSTCDSPYVQQQALKLKQTVETRIKEAQQSRNV